MNNDTNHNVRFSTELFRAPYQQYGGMGRLGPLVRATWTFDDGVQIRYNDNDRDRERRRKARVYVGFKDWSVIEDLENRHRRPHQVFKPMVAEALARIGVDFEKLSWNQRAGCSCGCSPGFILNGGGDVRGGDFTVFIDGAPRADLSKPKRLVVA